MPFLADYWVLCQVIDWFVDGLWVASSFTPNVNKLCQHNWIHLGINFQLRQAIIKFWAFLSQKQIQW